MYRFHPHIAEAHRRVAAGEIGRVLHIRSARVAPGRDRANPRYRREAGGGALMDIGCYCVNLSRALAGREPVCVTAQARFDAQTDVDLMLAGTLEFPGGAVAQFVCGFEGEPTYSAEVIGTEGRLTIPHPWMPPCFPNVIELTRRNQTETIRVAPPDIPQHVLAPFILEFDHFCACVRANRPPEFPPGSDAERDSRGNMRVIDALVQSARQQQPVALATRTGCGTE